MVRKADPHYSGRWIDRYSDSFIKDRHNKMDHRFFKRVKEGIEFDIKHWADLVDNAPDKFKNCDATYMNFSFFNCYDNYFLTQKKLYEFVQRTVKERPQLASRALDLLNTGLDLVGQECQREIKKGLPLIADIFSGMCLDGLEDALADIAKTDLRLSAKNLEIRLKAADIIRNVKTSIDIYRGSASQAAHECTTTKLVPAVKMSALSKPTVARWKNGWFKAALDRAREFFHSEQ